MVYNNEEAENAIIAAVLNDNNIIPEILPWIPDPNIFDNTQNKMIWNCMLKLNNTNTPIDLITLIAKCKEVYGDRIDQMHIIKASSNAVFPKNPQSYAKIVFGESVKRKVVQNNKRLEYALERGIDTIDSIIFNQMKSLEELLLMQPSKDREFSSVANRSFEEITTGNNVIKTKLPFIDKFASGLTRGEIDAIGGRPGHGKTTLALNIVKSLVENNINVMYISREMTSTEIIKKLICMETDMMYSKIRNLDKYPALLEKFINPSKNIILNKYSKNLRLYDDIYNLSGAVREIEKYKPDVFIDDYIQLTNVEKHQERRFDIEDIMRTYKNVAKKNKISSIVLSQLNRDIDNRIDQSPIMGDYAEGSTIEQVSETCMFVLYPYVFDSSSNSKYTTEIIAKKVRYGTVGTYPIGYNPDKCTYYNSEEEAMFVQKTLREEVVHE